MAHPALAIGEILTRLDDNPRQIAALTAHLTAAQLRAAPAPDAWSANDVLAHLRRCADVARIHPSQRLADHEHHHLDQFSRIATMVAARG